MTGQAALPLVAAVQDEKTVKEIGAEVSHDCGILARPLGAC